MGEKLKIEHICWNFFLEFWILCVCLYTLQCTTGHQGENPENEGLPGKIDGVSGRYPREASSSSSEWIQFKQEEEGAVTCVVLEIVFLHQISCDYYVNTLLFLYYFWFYFQNIELELSEDLISLNEILEVGLLQHTISLSAEIKHFLP